MVSTTHINISVAAFAVIELFNEDKFELTVDFQIETKLFKGRNHVLSVISWLKVINNILARVEILWLNLKWVRVEFLRLKWKLWCCKYIRLLVIQLMYKITAIRFQANTVQLHILAFKQLFFLLTKT